MIESKTITHYTDQRYGMFCTDPECHTHAEGDVVPCSDPSSAYDDDDCNGALLECDHCGAYLFPDDAAADHRRGIQYWLW